VIGLTDHTSVATIKWFEVSNLKQQFSVGDKAVYPVHGVAEVVALEQRDIAGSKTPVYILKIIETGLKIMVPTTNAGSVGLRDLISSRQVKEVLSILKSRDVPRDTQTWNRRYREYMEKIKTGSVFEIAEVLRDLSVLRVSKELSFGERKMLDTARGLLVRELAIAKGVGEDKIANEIDAIFAQAAA
jgi:CarD family transcriptional regulator